MADESDVVIGREMAAARAAEERRQASGPPPSPLPAERYRPDQQRLLDPAPSELDAAIVEFLHAYRLRTADERAAARDGIGTDDAYTLLAFARRSVVFALRSGDRGTVDDGLTACAAIGYERIDWRDGLVAIAMLHHAASRVADDPPALLRSAGELGEPAFVDLIEDLLARPASGRDLRDDWGYMEVDGPGGIGLLRCSYHPWAPTADLAGAGLRVADALRGDAYEVDDPELAVELPAYWLSATGDPSLESTLDAATGACVIQGRLRPEATPVASSQQLTAWVVELDSAAAAEHLVGLAGTPPPGVAMVASSQGPVLALVIARSFVDGVGPFEDTPRLARFERPLKEALEDSAPRPGTLG